MSQFLSKEQAHAYEKSVTGISKNLQEFEDKVRSVMTKEDFEFFKKLAQEPLKSKALADLLIKYKFLNPKMVAPEHEPGV